MGWWGCGIMEGDSPSDLVCEIKHHLVSDNALAKVDEDDLTEAKYEEAENAIEAEFCAALMKRSVVNELIRRRHEFDADEYETRLVIGVLVMGAGGPLSKKNKALIRTAAVRDEWATSSKERAQVMKDFIAQLDAYDGSAAVIIEQRGLFQAMGEALATGHVGLINK
jgi:hypothetical protein